MNYISLIVRYSLLIGAIFGILTVIPRGKLVTAEKVAIMGATIGTLILFDTVDPYVKRFSEWTCGCSPKSELDLDL